MLDRDDGSARWSVRFDDPSPFARSSYQRTPHPLFAGLSVLDGTLLVPGLDGLLHVLDVATGARVRDVPVGSPVAAPVTVAGDTVVVVTTEGGVLGPDVTGLSRCRRGG